MSYYEHGYGVDLSTDKIKWKIGVNEIIVDQFVSRMTAFKNVYTQYCKDNDLDPNDKESKENFVDDFTDDSDYGYDGLEGLIINIINTYVNATGFNAKFQYEDCCIYLPAYIPIDEKDKEKSLTVQDIQRILAIHLNPLLEEPAPMTWLDIYIE